MSDLEYLTLDDLLYAADKLLDSVEVRDYGLLESALARPRVSVFGEDAYPTVHHKAAALVLSLVGNHALVDGNKRLGLMALVMFYGLNGYALPADDDADVELILAIAEGRLRDVEEVTKLLDVRAVPSVEE